MEDFLHLITDLTTSQIFITTAICHFCYWCMCCLIAIVKKRADFADKAWGLSIAFIAWVSYLIGQPSQIGLIINLLISLWALRLTIHLCTRKQGQEIDFRYKIIQKNSSEKIHLWPCFQAYFLQGFLSYLIALPILWFHSHPAPLSSTIFWSAFLLWGIGFYVELLSDWQLSNFKQHRSHRGKLLMKGLWSSCRHPNYLGELCQWWAIWLFCATLPWGWALIISPVLLSILMIKFSGIVPLEQRMKKNPDFAEYAQKTPSLLPFSTANSLFYSLAQYTSIYFGAHHSLYIPMAAFLANIVAQMFLFKRWDRLSYAICIPLATYALGIGFIQESIFTHTGVLVYPNETLLPPLWLIYIYPMFSLTLNCSFKLLNKSLILTFFVGGLGSIFSYISGAQVGGVLVATPLAYPVIFFLWGTSLTALIILNRQLIKLYKCYSYPKGEITIFFDQNCAVCKREMKQLKSRKQTGSVIYACAASDEELEKYTTAFSYKQSMDKIHAINSKGTVMKGIDALSEVYARTNLSFLAILLQAPFFRIFFIGLYAIWAKLRISKSNNQLGRI